MSLLLECAFEISSSTINIKNYGPVFWFGCYKHFKYKEEFDYDEYSWLKTNYLHNSLLKCSIELLQMHIYITFSPTWFRMVNIFFFFSSPFSHFAIRDEASPPRMNRRCARYQLNANSLYTRCKHNSVDKTSNFPI